MVFHEVQRFSPKLLGLVWASVALLTGVIAVLASERTEGPVLVLPVASAVFLALFYCGVTMRTDVREGLLSVRLAALPVLKVPVVEIRTTKVVEYKPLRDFGGWGWRFGSEGTIYSASGNQAVRLEVKSRGTIFIGSAKPYVLAAALKTATSKAATSSAKRA